MRVVAALLVFIATLSAATVRWHIDYAGTPATRSQSVIAAPAHLTTIATDREGNVYVAGSTALPDLPLRNAAQPVIRSGSLLRSDDEGRTWEPLPVPSTTIWMPVIHPKTPSIILVSGLYGIFRSTDSGSTWQTTLDLDNLDAPLNRRTVGYLDDQIVYDPANPSRAWVGATGGVLRTVDGGLTWKLLTAGLQPGYCCTGASVSVDRLRPGRIAYVVNTNAWLSENGGDSWSTISTPLSYSGFRIFFDPFKVNRLYLQGYKQSFASDDAGATWTKLTGLSEPLTSLSVDPTTPGFLIGIAADTSHLLQSADYGSSWSPVEFQGLATSFQFDTTTSNRWYVTSYSPVSGASEPVVSTDRGRTWRTLNLSRQLQIAGDPTNPSRLFAGTESQADAWIAKYNAAGDLIFATYLGGEGMDTATAIAVDSKTGVVAVAGSTDSRDFPTSRATAASQSFVALYDPSGHLLRMFSVPAAIQSLAFGPDGALHAVWVGDAGSLPITEGGLPISSDGNQGYYTRISATSGDILFSTSLGSAYYLRLAVDRDGAPAIVGSVQHPAYAQARSKLWPATTDGIANLVRLSPEGRLISAADVAGSLSAVAAGDEGDLYIAGSPVFEAPVLPDAWQSQIKADCPHDSGQIRSPRQPLLMSDAWFARVDGALTTHKGGSLFGGSCIETVSSIAVASDGRITLTGSGFSDPLPSTELLALPPTPRTSRAYVAQFDANGTNLLGSSYVPGVGPASVAALDSGGFALVVDGPDRDAQNRPSVWSLSFESKKPLGITGARIAFAQTNTALTPGSIFRVKVPGLTPASTELGLNPAGGAPTSLAGISMTISGLPAPMLGVGGDEVTAIVPVGVPAPSTPEITIRNGSAVVAASYLNTVERLLTLYPDVRNVDGSMNSPDNPATERQPITLFLTGVPPSPSARDGELATWDSAPAPWLDTAYVRETDQRYEGFQIRPVPGFVYGLYYVTIPAPSGAGRRTIFLGQSTVDVYTKFR